MNILYLDYNGVLHDSRVMRNRQRGMYLADPSLQFFAWMPHLETLLAPLPEIKIVLSTSWVRAVDFETAKYELSPALRERVIGSTFHHPGVLQSVFDTLSRGQQILGDVERRKPANWLALDDDDFGWPAAVREHLVLTDGTRGISDPDLQLQLQQRLQAW